MSKPQKRLCKECGAWDCPEDKRESEQGRGSQRCCRYPPVGNQGFPYTGPKSFCYDSIPLEDKSEGERA